MDPLEFSFNNNHYEGSTINYIKLYSIVICAGLKLLINYDQFCVTTKLCV